MQCGRPAGAARVKDVMTPAVFTVAPTDPVKHVVEVLARHRIHGLPVVDTEGRLMGMLTEADLVAKPAYAALPAGDVALRWERAAPGLARHLAHGSGTRATDFMSAPVFTLSSDAGLDEAARAMVENDIASCPVLDDGRLVGIVARADLLRAYARSDEQIADEVTAALAAEAGPLEGQAVTVSVTRGVVEIETAAVGAKEAGVIEELAYRVPGVIGAKVRLHAG